jgi:hypothetical protein
MELKPTNKQVVEEVEYGMYVWQLPDGEVLGDGDGNVMNCFVWEKKDRPAARIALATAAKHYGHEEGQAVWWSGVRPINDEQLAEQIERASQGLTPDPLDIPAIRDDMRSLKNQR